MVKYTSSEIVFEEIPNEVTLAFNLSNCQNHCEGCHSAFLRGNVGDELTSDVIDEKINDKFGITCVCFMGEGNDPEALQSLITFLKKHWKHLKIALYSGREDVPEDFYWNNLDYLKIGPYKPQFGPLNKITTNQRFYSFKKGLRATLILNGKPHPYWSDDTYLFWTPEDYKKYREQKLEEAKKKMRKEIMEKAFE